MTLCECLPPCLASPRLQSAGSRIGNGRLRLMELTTEGVMIDLLMTDMVMPEIRGRMIGWLKPSDPDILV